MLNAAQAARLVLVAVFDCFSPSPSIVNFTASQDELGRWFAEGEAAGEEGPFYGEWRVDGDTGEISPEDQVARDTAALPCFSQP